MLLSGNSRQALGLPRPRRQDHRTQLWFKTDSRLSSSCDKNELGCVSKPVLLDPCLYLIVYVPPVSDPRHIDGLGRVVNLVQGAVITDANSRFVGGRGSDARPYRRGTMRATTFAGSLCNSFSALAVNATR